MKDCKEKECLSQDIYDIVNRISSESDALVKIAEAQGQERHQKFAGLMSTKAHEIVFYGNLAKSGDKKAEQVLSEYLEKMSLAAESLYEVELEESNACVEYAEKLKELWSLYKQGVAHRYIGLEFIQNDASDDSMLIRVCPTCKSSDVSVLKTDHGYSVICKNCRHRSWIDFDTKKDAVKNWNATASLLASLLA